jgi:uncharacterized membrane protein HdeD (DUF308 family)
MAENKVTLRQRFQAMPWWAVLIAGLAAILLSTLLIISPKTTVTAVMRIMGWLGLILGAVVVISIPFNRKLWGWKLFGGALAVIIGLVLRAHPLGSAYLLSALVVWCMGIGAILAGAALIIQGIAYAGWGRTIVGILSFAFGGVLIFTAVVGSLAVPALFGIAGVLGGVFVMGDAFRIRARAQAAQSGSLPGATG